MINPLLFMPSPRDIPEVKRWWHEIPYDKYICKYMKQLPAYTAGKKYFMDNKQYTHLIICPDDLEIKPDDVECLLKDVKDYGYPTIAGICNIDESQPDTYAIQPAGVDYTPNHPNTSYGCWYMKDKKPQLPIPEIFQVGHCGFSCQVIARSLMEKVSWHGSSISSSNEGNFDWQFSRDCHKLGIPIMVDQRVKMWHRRFQQSKRIKEWLQDPDKSEGYSFLMR